MSDAFTDRLFDISYWYHSTRSQSTLKMYGVIMTLEVIDKVLYSFGEYLIKDLLWKKLEITNSLMDCKSYIIGSTIYVFLHSLIMYMLMIGYNVLLNSDVSTFLIMVFVLNSMKIKSTLFKKFSESAYTS
jgi:hypothetical protein